MMFFWSEIPKWIYAVIALAIAAIVAIVMFVIRSQVSVSAGAVQYMDEYNQPAQTRESRRTAPAGGFAPREGAPEHNTRLPDSKQRRETGGQAFVPSQAGGRGDRQTGAPVINAPQQGRGERN